MATLSIPFSPKPLGTKNAVLESYSLLAYAPMPLRLAEGVLLQHIHKVRVVPWCLMVRFVCENFCHKTEVSLPNYGKKFCHAIHILSPFS